MAGKERVQFESEGMLLEGRFQPGAGRGRLQGLSPGVVICHPHPLLGGSMDNNVVYALEDHCMKRGLATLCFNFRGVGRSRGDYDHMRGEVGDVTSALWRLAGRAEVDSTRLGVMGYSFGGLMAAMAASRLLSENSRDELNSLCALALALVSPMAPLKGWEGEESLKPLYKSPPLTLVVTGTKDRYCSVNSARSLAVQVGPEARLVIQEGADHFYMDMEQETAETCADFMTTHLCR